MHDDFASLYAYDQWANEKILAACEVPSAEQYAAEPAPGWSSIRSTAHHLAAATEAWMRGLAGENVVNFPTEADLPDPQAVREHLAKAYAAVERLPIASADWASAPMTLRGGGRSLVLPPWVILRHVVNHGTYHRGQIAAKLKRLGVDPPATDLLFWALEQTPTARG